MQILGHSNAGFTHGLAASLYNGDILLSSTNSPSNLSPFIIFELDPLSSAQGDWCVQLHLLSKNTGGQISRGDQGFAEAGGESSRDVQDAVQSFVYNSGIARILFGKKSALVTGITELIHCICRNKIVFKTRIAGNNKFTTKFIFAVKIRIQCWF